ncbi:hypothetical protein OAE37_04140, partial [Pirellulaceae bacterium]|nr:hypothetical protein [Pirellulaceae bacterium]
VATDTRVENQNFISEAVDRAEKNGAAITLVDVVPSISWAAKLASSKLVLEGLVTEDFSKIKAGADEMNRFSRVEHWPSSDDAVYQFFSKTFRDQCKKLSRLAEAKNLEGSHYTYVHMTTTCVECHNYVRGNFKIAPNKKSPKGPVRLIPTYWDKEK